MRQLSPQLQVLLDASFSWTCSITGLPHAERILPHRRVGIALEVASVSEDIKLAVQRQGYYMRKLTDFKKR